MELQYEKALKDNNLKIADLPEDARIGIDNINDVLKGVRMLEKKGKTISEKTAKKIKAMDKWVYYEILDHMAGTDKNDEEMPDKDEVLDQIKADAAKTDATKGAGDGEGAGASSTDVKPDGDAKKLDEKGLKIDAELKAMFESGKTVVKLDELKNIAKVTYGVIFDGYDESGDNGVETSNFTLIETSEQEFTLTKK